jgi:hypothetical protein
VTIENLNPARLDETRTLQKVWFTDTAPKTPVVFDISDPVLTVYPPGAAGVSITLTTHPYLGGLWVSTPIDFDTTGTWVLVWGSGSASGAQPEFAEIYETVLVGGSYEALCVNAEGAATAVNYVGPPSYFTPGSLGYRVAELASDFNLYTSTTVPLQISGPISSIQNTVGNVTYGNAAIKADTAIAATQSTNAFGELTDPSHGLTQIQAKLTNGTYGLAAIETEVSNISSDIGIINSALINLTTISNGIAVDVTAALAAIAAVNALLTNGTNGLTAIKTAADILRPDNMRMQVVEGDANLPVRVQYQFKTSGMLNFNTPYLVVVMEFKDNGSAQPKVIYVNKDLP